MLFEQLPAGVITVVLAISCAVKYVAISRFISTRWYQNAITGNRWLLALGVLGFLNGVISFGIFNHFTEWPVNLLIAIVDSCFYVMAAVYMRQIKIMQPSEEVECGVKILLRILHALSYAAFIMVVMQ